MWRATLNINMLYWLRSQYQRIYIVGVIWCSAAPRCLTGLDCLTKIGNKESIKEWIWNWCFFIRFKPASTAKLVCCNTDREHIYHNYNALWVVFIRYATTFEPNYKSVRSTYFQDMTFQLVWMPGLIITISARVNGEKVSFCCMWCSVLRVYEALWAVTASVK